MSRGDPCPAPLLACRLPNKFPGPIIITKPCVNGRDWWILPANDDDDSERWPLVDRGSGSRRSSCRFVQSTRTPLGLQSPCQTMQRPRKWKPCPKATIRAIFRVWTCLDLVSRHHCLLGFCALYPGFLSCFNSIEIKLLAFYL